MNREEALLFLKNDLRHTEECIRLALATGKQRELHALQHCAEAYRFAIDVLQNQEEKDPQRPLTMAELRNMNGETVYCLDLNAEVTVHAQSFGYIKVIGRYPGIYFEDFAKNLTLYRTWPEVMKE